MGKKNILVFDNKKVFAKMFKKKFNKEFEFTDKNFLENDENKTKNYERMIFVVYDKFELIEFLKLYRKGVNILVCVFNKKLYEALLFLEEFNDLVLLDGSKTRKEIMEDLKVNYKTALTFRQQLKESLSGFGTIENQPYNSLRSIISASMV